MQKNKGFTLIELVITISLFSIIMLPIFTFYIRSISVFKTIDTKIELSHHGQFAFDYLDRVIKETRNIYLITGKVLDNDIIDVNRIIFTDGKGLNTFRISNNALKHDNIEVANYINDLRIELLPNSLEPSNYRNSKGIIINLYLKKDEIDLMLKNVVIFRNYGD